MLVFEIAAGIVLGVMFLYLAAFFIAWVASWSTGTKVVAAIIVVVLLVAAYREIFPDKEVSPAKVASSDLKNTPRETRAHFAARYKKDYPEYANTPDEALVKQVLHDHPEFCSRVEGGCP
jgi:hypothetical protein